MEFDDDGLDDEPLAPLLPPDDRLWRHPTEAGASIRPLRARGPAVSPPEGTPKVVTIVALTSCISVLLTLGVVAVVRPLRAPVAVERVSSPSRDVSSVSDVAELTARVRPAITQVVAKGPNGESWGSGVIYRSDGLMLTSQHIVKDAESVRAVLDTGVEVAGRLVGGDAETDIALIDLDGDDFPVATLGRTETVRIGSPAITIGSPASSGGGLVVRVSVVSALGQEAGIDGHRLVDMVQTDTTVAPGCAGAPVVNSDGVVIAIAAANVTGDAGAIGYATPIDVARVVAGQLLERGRVTRGWLGVEGDTLPADRARNLGVPGGAVVRKVAPGSPAAAAGLLPADVIVALDDAAMPTMAALVVRLRTSHPGDTIGLTVLRGDQKKLLKATLVERPT